MDSCNGKLTCSATLRGSTDLLRAKSVGLSLHHRRHTASRPHKVTKEAHVCLDSVQIDLQPGWEVDVHRRSIPLQDSWGSCIFWEWLRVRNCPRRPLSIQHVGRTAILAEP